MQKNIKGKIIIPSGRKPWPHELRVAQILSDEGHVVEFIAETHIKQSDILLDGTDFEIKSPTTNTSKKVLRNVKRALEQSHNVIIDTSRIKALDDRTIKKFLEVHAPDQKQLHKLVMITKRGRVVDIFP